MKYGMGLAVLMVFSVQFSALAHHDEGHHEPPALPSLPPPPLPPPPVVQPSIKTPDLKLPTLPLNSIIQTDQSGIRSGANESFMAHPEGSPTPPAAPPIAWDPRYSFTGEWLLFKPENSSVSSADQSQIIKLVSYSPGMPQEGKVQHTELPQKFTEPVFMPTEKAKFKVINEEHLTLHDGAVLVRAGTRPVFVSTNVNGERNLTRIAGGAVAMVSSFDKRTTALNLTDKCCGAVITYVPAKQRGQSQSVYINTGQVAEVYPSTEAPTSNTVATRIVTSKQVRDDIGLLVCDCNYVRAMKKFNLTANLPKEDLDRVLKTAAAKALMR